MGVNQYFKKIRGCCFDTNADQEEFYFTLNENQLIDFFSIKKKEEDNKDKKKYHPGGKYK